MANWDEDFQGWRHWPGLPLSAHWRYVGGQIEALDSHDRPIVLPLDDLRLNVKKSMALLPGIKAAGANGSEQRLLMALASTESGGQPLPVWGDCYRAGKWVPCGDEPHDPPRSVGYYQMLASTARTYGTSMAELAKSPAANHRAALRAIRELAPRTGGDLPTLAAIWQAGAVKTGPAPWGARAYQPDTLSRYVASWNLANQLNDQVPRVRPSVLASLHPGARCRAEQLVADAARIGVRLAVTSGRRSPEEQERLYAQGRTTPGRIVTHAKPGFSFHNYGLAFDVAPVDSKGRATWPENPAFWRRLGQLGKARGLVHGGDWPKPDWPHFHWSDGLTINQVREGADPSHTCPPAVGTAAPTSRGSSIFEAAAVAWLLRKVFS